MHARANLLQPKWSVSQSNDKITINEMKETSIRATKKTARSSNTTIAFLILETSFRAEVRVLT